MVSVDDCDVLWQFLWGDDICNSRHGEVTDIWVKGRQVVMPSGSGQGSTGREIQLEMSPGGKDSNIPDWSCDIMDKMCIWILLLVSTAALVLDAACCYRSSVVCVSVSLSVTTSWVLQKRMNRPRCQLGCGLTRVQGGTEVKGQIFGGRWCGPVLRLL